MAGVIDADVPAAGDARVVLYSRPGCHLCALAREVISLTCTELGVGWTEVDIDAPTPEGRVLRGLFTDQVPVTFVDGAQHDFWRVDPRRLRAALGRVG